MGHEGRRVESRTWGALPLVNEYIGRLQLDDILGGYLPSRDPRQKLPPARAIGLLVRNLVLCRRPLYALGEWAAPREAELLGLTAPQVDLLNDDRIGRALDRLFVADRASLVMDVVVRAVREFKLKLRELHNDSTTITFHGLYVLADGRPYRGKPTVVATWGHNKDHRPDLKQLLYQLTITTDGAVPLHYHVWDGNTTDDQTHIATWDVLCQIAGGPDFLYVGDCKVCTARTMKHIDRKKGRFLTILPRTRKEDQDFREWLRAHEAPWEEVWRREKVRGRKDTVDLYRAYEGPLPSAEGFRIVWIHTTEKEKRDRDEREKQLEAARRGLEDLRRRLASPKCRLRDRAKVDAEVKAALGPASAWIRVNVRVVEDEDFRQEKRGRPGPKTRYRKIVRGRFGIDWQVDVEAVRLEARTDGIFPLITNDRKLTIQKLLLAYKRQPQVEQRFDGLKNAHDVAPQYLKRIWRIEALLCCYFLALLVDALLERELRRGMKHARLKELPLYPEGRECKHPTTERLIELFEGLQVHRLYRGRDLEDTYAPELSWLQRKVMKLLAVPMTRYLPAP
ncbi:MAG: IS1634 family transposase [candidate division NC10 bacterium]|nr:IS1634 family transposase [candidate division NC10 bacterium]